MVAENVSVSENCLTKLTNEQSIGLKFIAICSFLSLLAILVTLALYIDRVLRVLRYSPGNRVFLKTDIDVYFLSLLFADMLVAVGGILNLKWISEGQTSCSGFCSAQGGLEHIGTPAVALSTLAIALHTFLVVFFRWTPPRTRVIGFSVLIGIWTFLFLLVLVPVLSFSSDSSRPPFYAPSPAWCYIGAAYVAFRAGTSYVFAWLAAIGSGIVYVLLFFHLRRAIPEGRNQARSLSGCLLWRSFRSLEESDFSRDRNRYLLGSGTGSGGDIDENDPEGRRSLTMREARKMLWYPLCYIIIILPLSATRWTSFTKHSSPSPPRHEVPFGLTAAAASLFKLGGVIDVLLFTFTRPNVLLFSASREDWSRERGAGSEPNLSERLRRLWRNCSLRWKRWLSTSSDGARGDAPVDEIEMRDMERSKAEPRIGVQLSGDDNERGGAEPHVQLIPHRHASAQVRARDYDDNQLRSSLPDARKYRQREPLDLDLSEEFDYKPGPISTSSPGSFRRDVLEERQRGSGTTSLLRPLSLDLPDPRISGLSGFTDSWLPIQREEGLAFSIPTSSNIRNSIGAFSQSLVRGDTINTIQTPSDSRNTRETYRSPSSSGSGTTRNERVGGDDEEISGVPDAGNVFRESSASEILTSPTDGKHTPEGLIDDGPFTSSPPLDKDPNFPLASRERRVRGPRPAPVHKSSSLRSSNTSGNRPRPARPTIGIPSPNSSRPSPSPPSSTRSPRLRFPQSALEAIPEHRLLDSFQPASTHFLHPVASTSPLSFRDRRPSTRPRSRSDGADLSQARRIQDTRDIEGGSRTKYRSFIDMT